MKKMKKLASILLAAIMVLAMAVPAMAATVTIEGTGEGGILKDHTFVAYQIFSGTQAEGVAALGDIEWGSGIDHDAFVTELAGVTEPILGITKGMSAKEVAEQIATFGTDSPEAKKVAEIADKHLLSDGKPLVAGSNEVDPGYYLIVDTTVVNGSENAARNVSLLQVTNSGDVEIKVKTDIPESQKKVMDINDSTGTPSGWIDSADYDIGDLVPFQLTGTLPNNLGDYDTYKLVFHDEQSNGLTFKPETVKVFVDGTELKAEPKPYTVKTEDLSDDCTFEIIFENVLSITEKKVNAESTIVVEYSSELNSEAVIGKVGNPNDMYMEYSNNPNSEGSGDTGKTPKDKVKVFTYKIDVDKVNAEGSPLEGAKFTLYKKDADNEKAMKDGPYKDYFPLDMVAVNAPATSFKFDGLDDGDYILVESTVPAGYNKAEDIKFTVSATHEDESADPQLLTFGATDEVGLHDGDVDGKVVVDKQNKDKKTLASGEIYGEIINLSGATLPETGGIGTTIFYVLGSILVVGAVILLVTKKRMSVEK